MNAEDKIQAEKKHYDKYEELCKKYGVVWNKDSPRLVGETLESLRKKHKEDKHLNNIPLRFWDNLARCLMPRTGLSLSQCVCMEKHAAKKLLELKENK